MFENKRVSVIIPIYNTEKFIGKTVESVLAQTYKDIELVIVDDCSTDKSGEIVRSYAEKYDNIVYHVQEKNEGAAVARNKALELATGRYVAFLDSDDMWYPQKMQKQIELMDRENAPMSHTAIEMVDENDVLIKPKRKVNKVVDYNFILKNTMLATSTMVVDRNITGNFSMVLRRSSQDYATWLSIMRKGHKSYGINEALVKYRIRNNSLSHNKFKSVKKVWDIQRNNEHINPVSAGINVCCFAFNAFKKYFF